MAASSGRRALLVKPAVAPREVGLTAAGTRRRRSIINPMLSIEPHPEGAILPVRAQPGARRKEIRGEQDGALKVCVTQSPEKGKANKALVGAGKRDITDFCWKSSQRDVAIFDGTDYT
jgi:uncharacterized protein YggU (UPF0235/DUF167 family)